MEKWSGTGEKIFKAQGCELCNNTGYIGRVGIFEILEIRSTISQGITDKVPAAQLQKIARQKGMETLRESGLKRVLEGSLSLKELARVVI